MYAFRDARPEDIAPILRLVHQGDVRGQDNPPLDEATLADPRYRAAFDQINRDPNNRLIVGEQAGFVVATLQITMVPGLPRFGLKRGILENVFVDPGQRGNGLGSAMVRWALDQCRNAGCGMVQLTSHKARPDAHRFYRKLGFEATHEGFKIFL